MNLFVTSTDPEQCARNLDDKRVGKMLMEATQMLSLALKMNWPDDSYESLVHPGGLTSGLAYKNHPVSIWVRSTRANYRWTFEHAFFLYLEFRWRFDKDHASGRRLPFLSAYEDFLPAGNLLPFQNSARNQGLGIDFTFLDVPYSYQEYLKERWRTDKRAVTFSGRNEPEWRTSS